MKETGFLRKMIGTVTGQRGKETSPPDLVNTTDEKLIELFISSKDERAFEEIVNRYADKIYRLAFKITRDYYSAEEILQEVFLTLINKIDTFRGESKFSSWLYRVTANAAYMHLRAQKKYENDVSLEDYVPYDENGTLMGRIKAKDWSDKPDKALLSEEAMEIIEKAVNELPEPYRVVFHLRDVEGFSNQEVSEVLGLSVPALKSRLHRARLYLRDKLSDYFYEWSK
ncbi:MAG: subfamily polymerase sigma-24 factor, polymerase sigma-70 factor, subfamily [Candidatus Dadabacteria bacterium]|nr:subfamily polymerase sigma-24 factor, polymerase sigma-70 factor, subfamily [Candidatus Dadabacteria bacterium]